MRGGGWSQIHGQLFVPPALGWRVGVYRQNVTAGQQLIRRNDCRPSGPHPVRVTEGRSYIRTLLRKKGVSKQAAAVTERSQVDLQIVGTCPALRSRVHEPSSQLDRTRSRDLHTRGG